MGIIECGFLTEVGADDVPVIAGLLDQLSGSTNKYENLKPADIFVVLESGRIAVARDEGRIVGIASLILEYKLSGCTGFIEDVVVDKKYRGRGIGRKLMECLISTGRVSGLKHVDLTSRPARKGANVLYPSLGFKQRDTNVYRLVF